MKLTQIMLSGISVSELGEERALSPSPLSFLPYICAFV